MDRFTFRTSSLQSSCTDPVAGRDLYCPIAKRFLRLVWVHGPREDGGEQAGFLATDPLFSVGRRVDVRFPSVLAQHLSSTHTHPSTC
jgi:hypothetical protein